MPQRGSGAGPGRVRIAPAADGVVRLLGLEHLPDDLDDAVRVVQGLAERAFATGGARLEAEIAADDTHARRALQRGGLRPEGRARGARPGPQGRQDVLRMGRLCSDPAPGTQAAFLAMLDASLPLKRVIVQGLSVDAEGRVLLCELTYKKAWDLPGGVADPAESPVASLERELAEELGLDLQVGRLLAVDWLPPYKQWSDAVLLVFDLGPLEGMEERARLQASELAALHRVAPADLDQHVAPYVARLLRTLAGPTASGGVDAVFLEDGLPRRLP